MRFCIAQCENMSDKEYFLRKAAQAKSNILLFPEMVGFNDPNSGLIVGSGSEAYENGDKPYNRYSLDVDGIRILHYDKQNLFPGYDNGRIAGNEMPYVLLNDFKIYISICYDIRNNSIFKQMEDPNIIIIPADFPRIRITDWRVLLQIRAIEKYSYVIGVNTPEGGNSMVISPEGDIIEEVGTGKQTMFCDIV